MGVKNILRAKQRLEKEVADKFLLEGVTEEVLEINKKLDKITLFLQKRGGGYNEHGHTSL